VKKAEKFFFYGDWLDDLQVLGMNSDETDATARKKAWRAVA